MESATEKYDEERDADRVTEDVGYKEAVSDMHFKAGQSKRVWGELYKVFGKSAIIVQQICSTCSRFCRQFWKVDLAYSM